MSFPEIISARSDDAVHPRRAQQRRYQTVGLLDAVAHPCAVIGACAIHYSRWRTCSEFASGAPRQRSASDPGTRGAQCRSGVPHTRFARAHRAIQRSGTVVAVPILGGLHHRYARFGRDKCWTKRMLIWTVVTASQCPQANPKTPDEALRASRLTGATVFRRFYILCNAA